MVTNHTNDPGTARPEGQASAKGSTLQATLAYVRDVAGAPAVDRVLARLAPRDCATVRDAPATREVPFALADRLAHAVEAELGAQYPDWPEESGAHAIESLGVQLYGGILRKGSPLTFLTQDVSLFRLYYHPGDIQPVEQEVLAEGGGRVVLRLDGFGHQNAWFCRRQTGGLARAVALAGGTRVRARHVRCALAGDAFCEWELRWAGAAAPETG